jgi:osmotically-inducible protein OsmY
MNRHLISNKSACFFLLLFCLIAACKEGNKEKDITEAVQSTTSVIDKNITVEVQEGVVTMKGEVADETTKTAAINAVKHIEGVKRIENHITVKAGGSKPIEMSAQDKRLKASIDSTLALNKISGVDITVSNGEVTLSGQVTRSQEIAIMKIAGDAHPARLKNFLTVTDKEN